MPSPSDLPSVLAKLRVRYAASSGETVAAFDGLAERLEAAPGEPDALTALRRELHRVHGTAGSYGFHEASRLAGALEPVATAWLTDPTLDLARRGAIVRGFARALQHALKPAAAPGATPP